MPLMRLQAVAALLAALAFAVGCDSAFEPDDATEITVLVAYTSAVAAEVEDVGAHVRQGFDETNAAYANSGVGARLVPVHLAEVDYAVGDRLEALGHLMRPDDEGVIEQLAHHRDGPLDDLHALRDRHEADVVLLVSAAPGSTINGSLMAEPSTAFLLVQWEALGAPSYGLAHEIGHLHGARHLAEDPPPVPFPYGHGFRNDSLRTIMAGGSQQKVPLFSGPGAVYEGVVLGDSAVHDVARVLRETAAYLSNFRGPQTPTTFEPPGSWPTLPDL